MLQRDNRLPALDQGVELYVLPQRTARETFHQGGFFGIEARQKFTGTLPI